MPMPMPVAFGTIFIILVISLCMNFIHSANYCSFHVLLAPIPLTHWPQQRWRRQLIFFFTIFFHFLGIFYYYILWCRWLTLSAIMHCYYLAETASQTTLKLRPAYDFRVWCLMSVCVCVLDIFQPSKNSNRNENQFESRSVRVFRLVALILFRKKGLNSWNLHSQNDAAVVAIMNTWL